MLGIQIQSRIRMFLGLPDPDPFVRGMDPVWMIQLRILPFSYKDVERTAIMLAK
jgi:hypothetical protein